MFKRRLVKKISVFTSFLLILILSFSTLVKNSISSVVSAEEIQSIKMAAKSGEGYSEYINKYGAIKSDYNELFIKPEDYFSAERVYVKKDFLKKQEPVLIMPDNSFAEWKVSIPQEGLYSVNLEYCAESKELGSAQCSFLIDGKIPFDESELIEFPVIFKDETPIIHNDGQDDLRPSQIEAENWVWSAIKDRDGYYSPVLRFYFTEGEHTFCLKTLSGTLAISSMSFITGDNDTKSYENVSKEYSDQGIVPVTGVLENGIKIYQAESAYLKSDATLYPVNDNSSDGNQPFDIKTQKINCIGGTRWQSPGQWITWQIDVPQSGLYHIGFRSRQNYLRDIDSIRSLYIDDKIQFSEASEIPFEYNNKFSVSLVGGDAPYLFYLEKGIRTIRMEVSLGKYSEYIRELANSIEEINKSNWSLLTFIGNNPDLNRDYNIEKYMPEVIDSFGKQLKKLKEITQSFVEITGKEDSNIAQINELIYKLKRMCDDPTEIPKMFSNFREDVSALANTVLNMKNMPLLIDYIFIAEQGAKLPNANPNIFVSFINAIKKFIASFVIDYTNLSNIENTSAKEPITVWIGNGLSGGRDQAVVLNQLIVQDFTPKTSIPVNLQLVPAGTILTATISGKGPDAALQVNGEDPVNYAMRNAVVDLSKMEGYSELLNLFPEAAMIQYKYKDGVYALPETITFPMMFYRKDILENLGIEMEKVKTWKDLIGLLPIIQRSNMQISMQPTFSSYYTFLFQNGASLYTEDNKHSALNSKVALDAFNTFMGLYTNYGMPYSYNFVTRFRTGEIPISIEDYTMYNTLKISAPEINGQWEMCSIPGTVDAAGNVNRNATVGGNGCIILSSSDSIDEAWTFLKWWVATDTQYKYGKELESVMGVGARYNTANLEALDRLPWTTLEKQNLKNQISNLQGVVQVPGGYMTSRNIGFAISTVYNNNSDARKTMLNYIDEINQELEIKYDEFS